MLALLIPGVGMGGGSAVALVSGPGRFCAAELQTPGSAEAELRAPGVQTAELQTPGFREAELKP